MALIDDKMQKTKLRWFVHVQWRGMDAPVRSCERLAINNFKGGRGRPNKYCELLIRQEIKQL